MRVEDEALVRTKLNVTRFDPHSIITASKHSPMVDEILFSIPSDEASLKGENCYTMRGHHQ